MIHTVRGFAIVNKAEIDVFLELSCFFNDPVDVGNLISGSSVLEWGTLVAGPGSGRGSLSQMVRASFASNLNPHTWTRAFSLVVLGHSHPHLPPSRNERGPGLHLLMRTEVGAWVSSPHPFFLGEIMLKICLLTLPWSWDRAPVNVGGGEGSRA